MASASCAVNRYGTGNPMVDGMGRIRFEGQGIYIPCIWKKTITHERSGRPDRAAAELLADCVYWASPETVVDEYTGDVTFRKRFRADDEYLRRTYEQLQDKLGVSKGTLARALAKLEELGAIRRHRSVETTTVAGVVRHDNVFFIEVVPEVVEELTYPTRPRTAPGPAAPGPERAEEPPAAPEGGPRAEGGAGGVPVPGRREVREAADRIDALAPKKAGRRRPDLESLLERACRARGCAPSDMVDAYRAYLSRPRFWPRRQKGRRLYFALRWLQDEGLVDECLRYVAERRDRESASGRPAADLVREAGFMVASGGKDCCYVTHIAGRMHSACLPRGSDDEKVVAALAKAVERARGRP